MAFGGVIWESKARNLFYRGTLFLGDMYTKKTCIVVADILGQDILYSCGLSCIEFFDVVAYPGPNVGIRSQSLHRKVVSEISQRDLCLYTTDIQ